MTGEQTLKEVQLAIEAIEELRGNLGLTKDDKRNLELCLLRLSNIEQAIIREIGNNLIITLTNDAKALNELISKINKSSESLASVAKKIEKVTALVNALSKVLPSGAKLL